MFNLNQPYINLFLLSLLIIIPELNANERIVSAGGSVTEVLYALGLQEQIVAVDTSSLYPASTLDKPKVGYYRQLSSEGVISASPTVLVGHGGMGPESVLGQIKSAGIDVIHIKESTNVDGIFGLINTLAKRFNRLEQGQQLIESIQHDLGAFPPLVNRNEKAAFFLSVGERGLIAAGSHTMPDGILASMGVTNLFSELKGYKPVAPEALIQMNPDYILLAQHSVMGQSLDSICRSPSIKLWVEANGCRVYPVDSLVFMGLSPRIGQAREKLYQISQSLLTISTAKNK
jgi:iron complex transport system substrate-binding protein